MIDWPVPAQLLARPDGGEVAWWEAGEGSQTLLWVHGLPLDSRSWAPQLGRFAIRARNVLVDLRGYGRSAKLPAEAGSVTQLYVDDLVALIEAIGGPPPVVVGFASAGHVVLRLAAQARARIAGAVSINGSPRFVRGEDWPFGFDAGGLERFAAPLREGRLDAALDLILDPETVFGDMPADEAARIAASFREMGRLAGARTLLGFFDSIASDDDRDLLPDIDVPVLLIASVAGREVPGEVGLWVRGQVRRAVLAEVAGGDHFVFATRPALVNALIDDFRGTLR